MKYATLDKNGLPTAFYSDDVHSDIPKEAIEITDEQWLECINNQGQRHFIDGELVEYIYVHTDAEIAKQVIDKQKSDYQSYLDKTDHKMFIDYEPKVGEDLEVIKAERKTAREYIRDNI